MKYPTADEIAAASHLQLAQWWRHLDSPGTRVIRSYMADPEAEYSSEEFDRVLTEEADLMDLIRKRLFVELGGFTPAISKAAGWEGAAA